jgi:hypothetical protein
MDGRFPFSYRVACLLALMAVVVIVDFSRHGAQASKYREYGFILIAGMTGAVVGFVNDWMTCSLSPDYFLIGKGLEPGPDLRMRAGKLGLQAGLSAGIIGGAVCLFASVNKVPFSAARMRRLLAGLWMPLLGAALLGLGLPAVAGRLDPFHFSAQLGSMLTDERISRFQEVWWRHTGLYGGMIIGLGALILVQRTTRAR